MFEQNLKYLEKKDPQLYQEMLKYQQQGNAFQNKFIVRKGKKGYEYLEENSLEAIRIHSLYDPTAEAKALFKKYEKEIEAHDFIVFFGVGLGYHIQLFKEMYPKKIVYIYEPELEIFYYFIKNNNLKAIDACFAGDIEKNLKKFIDVFFKKNFFILSLSVYIEQYKEIYFEFLNAYKKFLEDRRHNRTAVALYEKRWLGNTILNFETIYQTPGFVKANVREYFQNKSVLIVSAGPSLNFEIENLRKIKEEKTAYIFAVGSAIHTLLAHKIKPDALFSFDPHAENMEHVFEPILNNEDVQDIPLIFGTTIAFEVLQAYPGKLSHIHINRGALIAYLFNVNMYEIHYDAPTVAALLLQVLLKLEVKNIIFVGQNLALWKGKEFSDNIIQHKGVDNPVDMLKFPTTESVTGEKVYTTSAYLSMKSSIETVIGAYGRKDIINTTVGGAQINGTIYLSLGQVMQNKLTEPIVDEDWFETVVQAPFTEEKKKERYQMVSSQYKKLMQEKARFYKKIQSIQECLTKIGKALENNRMDRVEKLFSVYDDHMTKIEKNPYYIYVIMPVIESILQRKSDHAKQMFDMKLSAKELAIEKWELLTEVIDLIEKAHFFVGSDLRFIQEVIDEESSKYDDEANIDYR